MADVQLFMHRRGKGLKEKQWRKIVCQGAVLQQFFGGVTQNGISNSVSRHLHWTATSVCWSTCTPMLCWTRADNPMVPIIKANEGIFQAKVLLGSLVRLAL